jgi:integrase
MLGRELAKAQSDTWIEPRDRKMTIGTLIEDLRKDHETRRKTRFSADTKARWELHFKAAFDNIPAYRLTTTMLNQYKAKRFAEQDKPAVETVGRELHDLRRAYKLAAASDLPKVGDIRCSSSTGKRMRVWSSSPRRKWTRFARLHPPNATNGAHRWNSRMDSEWRRGELLGLRVGDFDLLAGTVRIETSKNGRPREGVLTDNPQDDHSTAASQPHTERESVLIR